MRSLERLGFSDKRPVDEMNYFPSVGKAMGESLAAVQRETDGLSRG